MPEKVNTETEGAASNKQPYTSRDVRMEGAGKAYQSVAQSTAIAIQDAADSLRNVNTICATAVGISMARFIETGEPQYAQAMELIQQVAAKATENYRNIGESAADVLKNYPSGE